MKYLIIGGVFFLLSGCVNVLKTYSDVPIECSKIQNEIVVNAENFNESVQRQSFVKYGSVGTTIAIIAVPLPYIYVLIPTAMSIADFTDSEAYNRLAFLSDIYQNKCRDFVKQ